MSPAGRRRCRSATIKQGLGAMLLALCGLGLPSKAVARETEPCARAVAGSSHPSHERVHPPVSPASVSALVALGDCARRVGDLDAAVEGFQRALDQVRRIHGEHHLQTAAVQDRLAQVQAAAGRGEAALANWRAAVATLALRAGHGHPDTTAVSSRLASALAERGAHAEALVLRQQVLAAYRRLGHAGLQATALSNLANSLDELGQDALALQRRGQALRLLDAQPRGDRRQYAVLLHEMARSHLLAGRTGPALDAQERALAALRASGEADAETELALRAQWAEVLLAAGRSDAARAELLSLVAAVRARQGDEAPVLSGLWRLAAQASLQQGDPAQALAWLHAAHGVAMSAGNPERLWRVLADLAAVHARLGEADAAIVFGKQAVQVVQELRAGLGTLDRAWQERQARGYHPLYQLLADQLVAQGRLAESQQVMDLLRLRELDDTVRRGAVQAQELALTGLEQRAFERYARLRAQQVAIGDERRALRAKDRSEGLGITDKARLEVIETRLLPALSEAVTRFLLGLQQQLASDRMSQRALDPAGPSLSGTRERLSNQVQAAHEADPQARAVALQYIVSDDRLTVLLYVPGMPQPIARQLAVPRKTLTDTIQNARLVLQDPHSQPQFYLPLLQQLYAWLIAPVADDLRAARAGTLMLSLSDTLRYLPFAALHDGQRYLVQSHALALVNPALDTRLDSLRPARLRVAALGSTRAVDGLPPLPGVATEIEAVVHMPGIEGRAFIDRDFDRQRLSLVSGDASYNVLHVASHFRFVSGRPELSSLYLGDRSRLTLADLQAQGWQFTNKGLVVFSACETAVGGGHDAYGQEVEGLGATVQRQGAAAAMVTLWKVADRQSAGFVTGFYGGLARGLGKAAALREAQVARLQRPASQSGPQSHPFFWAPFIVMGNWRQL